MRVRVLAFAQLKDLLGPSCDLDLPAGATLSTAWSELCRRSDALAQFRDSTQIARNGSLVRAGDLQLSDGDEVALLPPVGGG